VADAIGGKVDAMKAIVVRQTGGSDTLAITDEPDPRPGPGQVVVRVSAIGVNFVDVYYRTGRYPRPLPFVLGSEAAGRVDAVGDGVPESLVGTRVVSSDFAGAYAEQAVAETDRVVPVPDAVSDELAAAALLQGMTAHYLLHDSYPLRPGDTVLVPAAAGGMGLLLTQLATRMGARVLGAVSTPEKADLARAAGAAEVFGYDDLAASVRAATGGAGVAAVYDGVGASTFEAALGSLRPGGFLISFGSASGPVPPVDLGKLTAAGSVFLQRPTLGHFVADPADLRRRASAVFGWIADGIDFRIGGRYPLADAGRAHDDLEGRRTTGKLLLLP
jgi:NADPH2:quinone reductase